MLSSAPEVDSAGTGTQRREAPGRNELRSYWRLSGTFAGEQHTAGIIAVCGAED